MLFNSLSHLRLPSLAKPTTAACLALLLTCVGASTASARAPFGDPALPPSSIDCTTTPLSGSADLSWTNNGDYSSIEILVNGLSAMTVSGTSTSASVVIPTQPILVELCLRATTLADVITEESCCSLTNAAFNMMRGDFDNNGSTNGLLDGLALLSFAFLGGTAAPCLAQADTNGDGSFSALLDGLFILNWTWASGAPLPAPFPACGAPTATDLALGCLEASCP